MEDLSGEGEVVWICDYDLPANSSRRNFYRHVHRWLKKHKIKTGVKWSTRSVVITPNREFAEFVYDTAVTLGKAHLYKAERIK